MLRRLVLLAAATAALVVPAVLVPAISVAAPIASAPSARQSWRTSSASPALLRHLVGSPAVLC